MIKDNKKPKEPAKPAEPVISDSSDFSADDKHFEESFNSNAPEGAVLEELPEEVKKKLAEKKDSSESKSKKGKKARSKKKKVAKNVSVGKAFIRASYNNTIVTLTDLNGEVISWASAGMAGFKGPKKSTPYAAGIITRIAVEKAKQSGLKEVSAFVKGVGTGREAAARALNTNGLIVTSIKDVTPIPHNGCRPKKPRRV
jgi:small subunit ribosomal protein S11